MAWQVFLLVSVFVICSIADERQGTDVTEIQHGDHDMILTPSQKAALKSRTMVRNFVKLWPGGQVPYVFDASITSSKQQVSKLNQAFDAYKNKTCIRFVQRTNEQNYIRFKGGKGFDCYSYLGMTGGEQILSFTNDCPVGTAIHEAAHALGFMHEHMRPDRDSYITVDYSKIDEDWKSQYKKVGYESVYVKSSGTKYDYTSVLHYGSGGVIKTIDPNAQNKIGQRKGFGKCDATKINNMYDCVGYERLAECFN